METYEILVKTNSYAGNFEREMCAFMTGGIGDCKVGEELVDGSTAELFEEYIRQEPDENGCIRPAALDEDCNNFIIYLHEPLTENQIALLKQRAKLFEETKPYKYLDKDFKFLGIEQYKVVTTVKRKKI